MKDSKSEEEDDDESDDSSDSSEENMDASDITTKKEQTSEANDESDNSSEPPLDDEAMFKLDKQIAAALKLSEKTKKAAMKQRQKAVADFKFRLMDLLDYYLDEHHNETTVFTAINSLMQIQRNTHDEASIKMCRRITRTLERLFKMKGHPKGSAAIFAARKLISTAFTQGMKAKHKLVAGVVPAVIRYAIRILTRQDDVTIPTAPSSEQMLGHLDLTEFGKSALMAMQSYCKNHKTCMMPKMFEVRLMPTSHTEIF